LFVGVEDLCSGEVVAAGDAQNFGADRQRRLGGHGLAVAQVELDGDDALPLRVLGVGAFVGVVVGVHREPDRFVEDRSLHAAVDHTG
jgi:hypothetical protein